MNGSIYTAVRDLQTLFEVGSLGGLSDGQLLDRFVARREGAVFEVIVLRHGPMVWGVCRRVLRDHHDAEDAFQATFLVLARKAASVMPREMLGNWLYGVAYQTALKARAARAKRRMRECQVSDTPEPMMVPHDLRDALADCLDGELSRLPEKYRIPIVLCDLEGRTHKEAASQLGWPIGTVSSRLSRARTLLASRLSRRGVSLSAGSLAVLLAQDVASAGMPTQLISSTAQAASLFAAGGAVTAGVVSAEVGDLIGEVLKVMLIGKLKIAMAMLLVASVFVAGGAGLTYRARATEPTIQEAPATEPTIQEARPVEPAKPDEDPPISPHADQNYDPLRPYSAPNEDTRPKRFDRRPRDSKLRTLDDPDAVPVPQDPTTKGQDQLVEDPLAEQIMAGAHTPEQLERAKKLIESMLTLEKEAHSKSPEELNKMIQDRTNELEEARWQVRVMDAQLRRLKKIKEAAQDRTSKRPAPSAVGRQQSGADAATPTSRRRSSPGADGKGSGR